MNEKMLPLLSDGLKKIIENINNKHFCEIAKDLLEADNLIIAYNNLSRVVECSPYYNPLIELATFRINALINEEARMLSFRHNAFEISYLPKGKEAKYSSDGVWSRENRQTAKPARIIQKLLVTEYKCKEYEDFSNWIKAEMLNAGEFKIVTGFNITKYYNEEYYYNCNGTLGNSCMRHSECRDYFDVYEDHAKMLVCFKDGLVLGRAIIWEIDGKTYMDRIYTCMDYLESQFIDYARINKWHYRETNCLLSDGEYQKWYGPDDNYNTPQEYDLTIKLSKVYDYMPYVDSFRYYNEDTNSIHTNPKRGHIRLSDTDGSYLDDDDYEIYECARCGYEERVYEGDGPNDLVYSEYEDNYYCPDCSVYCGGIDDYVSINTDTVNVYVSRHCTERWPLSEVEGNGAFIVIDDKWYNLASCDFIEYNDKLEEYRIKDE